MQIGDDASSPLDQSIDRCLLDQDKYTISYVPFKDIKHAELTRGCSVIFTTEYSRSVLSDMSVGEMESLKAITDAATSLFWVTHGDTIMGQEPEMYLVTGLARTLMLEQPTLKFATFDVDFESSDEAAAKKLVQAFDHFVSSERPELEYALKRDITHVSRWVPDVEQNKSFQRRQDAIPIEMSLQQAGPVSLATQQTVKLESLCFVGYPLSRDLAGHEVEVQVESYGVNPRVSVLQCVAKSSL